MSLGGSLSYLPIPIHDKADAVGTRYLRCPRDIIDVRRNSLSSRHRPPPSLPACYPMRRRYASRHVRSMTTAQITLRVHSTQAAAPCPLCAMPAQRSHSSSERTLAALPWAEYRVRLQLRVRTWFCRNRHCRRRIFTERLPAVVAPWARRTLRLPPHLLGPGVAFGGKAGVRPGPRLSLAAGPNNLLPPPGPPPL